MDEERLDRARAEFRELLRRDQHAGPDPQGSRVHSDSVEELCKLAKEELVARYDVLAEEARRYFPIDREESMRYLQLAQLYLDELRRREAVDQGERMEELTRSLKNLTWWIVALTVVIAGATLVGVGWAIWAEVTAASPQTTIHPTA